MHSCQNNVQGRNTLTRPAALCLLILLSSDFARAAGGSGRVNMQGAVIETACAIDTDSSDQTIDMSVMPLSQIIRDGQGVQRPFGIRLVNCVQGRVDKGLFRVEG